MKVAFTTLGCRTNQHDTAEMATLLEEEGYSIVGAREPADVYVINTCTVTQKSDRQSRQAVKKSLAINDQALVVFTGCYAQMNPEDALNLPGMDLVLGNADKLEIAAAIKNRMARNGDGSARLHMTDITRKREFRTIPVAEFHGKTKAFIKVQTGCDEKCSFCTVVHARGKSISESRQNILHNIRRSVDSGFKEITLTGINLGTYGRDKSEPETFSSLVEEILKLAGAFRVRLSSINPMEIDDRLIDLMAENEKLCPHLHIPLQSGDDHILKRMRRNYDTRQYQDVVQRAVEKVPNLGLGADIIVGFPGETDAMFENTRAMVEKLPYSYLHVFTYSARPKTEAEGFHNDVPDKIKKERNRVLTELGKKKSVQFRKQFIGRTLNLLVETQRDKTTGQLKGHSENYIPVQIHGGDSLAGDGRPAGDGRLENRIVPVTVTEVTETRATGCLP
ncbi:MAG: tRNA (N(6)-L-threonylcarbamoyladenosine(37)-C(2))-methylthiotransferase MtaB [Nitrospinae bacterium]|nr:tRNA (N(6)-L-threonylcarbamoyladenosine(37)-C(2))-methylthiotransferase MtaB [Nitrospinota bacterium]